jgi:LysM repeat protein
VAKRKYKPYRTRKQSKQHQLRLVAMILIALIVGFFVLKKMYKGKDEPVPADPDTSETALLDDILPDNGDDTDAPTAVTPPVPVTEAPEPTRPPVTEAPAEPVTPPVTETPKAADTATTDESTEEARELVRQAIDLDRAGKIIATRDLLNEALQKQLSSQLRAQVKTRMTKLADKWLFSRDVYESDNLTEYYLVQPGDSLTVIAKRYKVPYELLMEINGIDRPENLRAGKKIKVVKGPFNAVVYKDSFTIDLLLQHFYIKTYRVGLGKPEHDTPPGHWRVKSGGKMIRPPWTDPDTQRRYSSSDPDYPLGSRWIAIEGLDDGTRDRTGFALHGTKDPESIGTRSSRGCIRLYNGDVVEVYNLLREGVSEVVIFP